MPEVVGERRGGGLLRGNEGVPAIPLLRTGWRVPKGRQAEPCTIRCMAGQARHGLVLPALSGVRRVKSRSLTARQSAGFGMTPGASVGVMGLTP